MPTSRRSWELSVLSMAEITAPFLIWKRFVTVVSWLWLIRMKTEPTWKEFSSDSFILSGLFCFDFRFSSNSSRPESKYPHYNKKSFPDYHHFKVFNGPNEKTFYSLSKFHEWKAKTLDSKSWRVKYYKGLGTSTTKEAKEYFQDLESHRLKFSFSGSPDEAAMTLVILY